MYLPSVTAQQVNRSITHESGVEFQMETNIIYRRGFISQITQIWIISVLILLRTAHKCTQFFCFYTDLLFLPRPRFLRRHGLLKIPNLFSAVL